MPEFPHMSETAFPHYENVDVYKYRNEFDYSRYDSAQMHIMLCSVPWDMGEAHIGNRTISGIGNVVWFETEDRRDAWFDAIPDSQCYRFDTKYKELHRDNMIAVPVPFDIASNFNYLVVEYEPFANADSMVQYESLGGLKKWFWFIREVEFVSPNTTILHLMNDAFQTFMYRMHFAGMILERGHAPMLAIDADTYLANPIDNNAGLLAEDVNFGDEPAIVRSETAHVFNSDTYACIACTGSVTSDWGTKGANTWHTPASARYSVDGVPDVLMFGMQVSDLNSFLQTVESDYPQFKQTIKAVFFAPAELIDTGTAFTFAGTNCFWISTSRKQFDFLTLDKSKFGYPAKYADLAKLYTYPYAHIEVTDENGNIDVIRVEDTTGTLKINAAISLAYPALNVQAHITGVGGSSTRNITFSNITSRSLTIGGKWYSTLKTWDIPTFGVIQSSAKQYDYSTHFDRIQQVTAYTNAYNSAIASADTAETNTKAQAATAETNTKAQAATAETNTKEQAATAKENANAQADNTTDNAALQATANTAMTAAGNTMASDDTQTGQTLNTNTTNNAIDYTNASTNNSIDMANATAAASQASNAISAAATAGASIASGGPAGAAGAIAAVASGIGQAAVINATNEAGVNYTTAQAAASNQNNRRNAIDTNVASAQTNDHAVTAANSRRDAANALTTGAAANTAATIKGNSWRDKVTANANAERSKATTDANAERDKNTAYANAERLNDTETANAARARNTSQEAITNGIKQAALNAPFEYGSFADNQQATTKPIAMFANVVTQTKNAIEMTGDEFLRYGYYYGKQWNFDGNWNIGEHFTYWKLKDFWVKGLNIPDMYVDKLRFFLYGGVTVWRNPEDIGYISIYENGI